MLTTYVLPLKNRALPLLTRGWLKYIECGKDFTPWSCNLWECCTLGGTEPFIPSTIRWINMKVERLVVLWSLQSATKFLMCWSIFQPTCSNPYYTFDQRGDFLFCGVHLLSFSYINWCLHSSFIRTDLHTRFWSKKIQNGKKDGSYWISKGMGNKIMDMGSNFYDNIKIENNPLWYDHFQKGPF